MVAIATVSRVVSVAVLMSDPWSRPCLAFGHVLLVEVFTGICFDSVIAKANGVIHITILRFK